MPIMDAPFRLRTVRRQLPWSCLVPMPSIGICGVWMTSLPPVASQSLPPAVMSPDVYYPGFASQSLPPAVMSPDVHYPGFASQSLPPAVMYPNVHYLVFVSQRRASAQCCSIPPTSGHSSYSLTTLFSAGLSPSPLGCFLTCLASPVLCVYFASCSLSCSLKFFRVSHRSYYISYPH